MPISAGLLPYRLPFEVLIAHPGGPLFAAKDVGAWSIVKGEVDPGEEFASAAAREFAEETGWLAPVTAGWLNLGSVRLRSGKTVHGFGVAADFDPETLSPGTFQMFWHGRHREFPEIDRVRWCQREEARHLLNPAQGAFVDRLAAIVGG